jgi:hypothetical protein
MDGWMDRWMVGEYMDGWMDGWTDGHVLMMESAGFTEHLRRKES